MAQQIGFDNQKYLEEQTKEILARVKKFKKLYLEVGGKIIYDAHAARVLPGYDPQTKIKILQQLKDQIEVILCIYAKDIIHGKIRGDFGITYDLATLKLIDDLKKWGIDKVSVVITRYTGESPVEKFRSKLTKHKIPVFIHHEIKDYPDDVEGVVSDNGYGKNCYIPTKRSIVVVTGPGPNSGKLATCLSQIYHNHKQGKNAGYAKLETFPVWDLPIDHPVNIAYEAATADIGDFNMIDPFHLKAYNETVVNYNRDVEAFPLLSRILIKIMGDDKKLPYQSPTDMGVNKVGFAIINNEVVQEAARQEIIRRYFRYICEFAQGAVEDEVVDRIKKILANNGIKLEKRLVVQPARAAAENALKRGIGHKGISCGAAIELPDGDEIVSAHNSELLHAGTAVIIKALKRLADISAETHLISEKTLKSLSDFMQSGSTSLDLEKALIVFYMDSQTNSLVQDALSKLEMLKGCEMHMTHIPTPGDKKGIDKCGINLTCDPNFSSTDLFDM